VNTICVVILHPGFERLQESENIVHDVFPHAETVTLLTRERGNVELAQDVMSRKPDILVLNNTLLGPEGEHVSGITVAKVLRGLPDGEKVTIVLCASGQGGWADESFRRTVLRVAQIEHGAQGGRDLKESLQSLKLEKFSAR
jgi:hypothetical protein